MTAPLAPTARLVTAMFAGSGVLHLVRPQIFEPIVPRALPAHRELVALMIRAAHTFGLTVVAEGVEEPAQLARLKAQDCDQAQGYLLYRPMPAP